MPRLTKQLPKYRLHKSTGQAVVSINGQRVYLGPFGSKKSRRNYLEAIQRWQAERCDSSRSSSEATSPPKITATHLHGVKRESNDLTVIELIAAYRNFAREYYRKNGEITREAGMIDDACRIFIGWHDSRTDDAGRPMPNLLVDEFGPMALEQVRETMIDTGWSRKTINKQVARIIRMFRWGTAKELVEPQTLQRLQAMPGLAKGRTRARECPPIQPVSEADVKCTLRHLPQVVADMVRFQRLTGCRPGEVCGLRPADIDRNTFPWVYTPYVHKMQHHGRHRKIFLGPKAQEVIRPYLDRRDRAFCFSPAESEQQRRNQRHAERKTPLSSGNRPGTNRAHSPARRPRDHYEPGSYRRAVHRACRQAGVRKWSPNQLRHAAATEIRSRYGLEAAQVVLGHAVADVTQVYAERDLKLAALVAQELG